MFLLAKNQYSVVVVFKMLKIKFKFKNNINNESVNHFSQFISVKGKNKFKKNLGSILGKVKKIEAQAK